MSILKILWGAFESTKIDLSSFRHAYIPICLNALLIVGDLFFLDNNVNRYTR